jgi:hypothetical protein
MTDQASYWRLNLKLFIIISMLSLVGGYFYVMALGTGYRAYIYIHGGILLFFGISIFLHRIKTFLLFLIMASLSLGFGRHLVYEKLDFEASLFSVGIRIDASDVILVALYIHWILHQLKPGTGSRPLTLGGRIGGVFLIWITYVMVSSFFTATRLNYSMYEILVYLKGFLLYFYLINNIDNEDDLKTVILGIFAASMILALYMIAQYITKTTYTIQGEQAIFFGPEGFRSRGFSGSPDQSSALVVFVFPLFFLSFYYVKAQLWKSTFFTCMLLMLLAIIFSKVRIAFASLGIALALSLFLSYRRRWLSWKQIFLTVLVGTIVALAMVPLVYYRFAHGVYGEDRWPLIVTAYNMFKSNILFGVGANNYNFVVMRYVPAEFVHAWLYTVHNEYFIRLCETGLLGFLLYYGFIFLVLAKFYRSTVSREPMLFLISCAFFSSIVGSFVHRLVSMYHYQPFFPFLCVIYALSVIVDAQCKKEQAKLMD